VLESVMLLQTLMAAAAMHAAPAPPVPLETTSAPVFVAAPVAALAPSVPVALQDLEAVRGGDGTSIALTVQSLNAINSGHIEADEVSSGAIAVGANAFGNFDGIGNFVMNTGHENNIQSTVSVTITMTPTTP
jgi:hypothetical protein